MFSKERLFLSAIYNTIYNTIIFSFASLLSKRLTSEKIYAFIQENQAPLRVSTKKETNELGKRHCIEQVVKGLNGQTD